MALACVALAGKVSVLQAQDNTGVRGAQEEHPADAAPKDRLYVSTSVVGWFSGGGVVIHEDGTLTVWSTVWADNVDEEDTEKPIPLSEPELIGIRRAARQFIESPPPFAVVRGRTDAGWFHTEVCEGAMTRTCLSYASPTTVEMASFLHRLATVLSDRHDVAAMPILKHSQADPATKELLKMVEGRPTLVKGSSSRTDTVTLSQLVIVPNGEPRALIDVVSNFDDPRWKPEWQRSALEFLGGLSSVDLKKEAAAALGQLSRAKKLSPEDALAHTWAAVMSGGIKHAPKYAKLLREFVDPEPLVVIEGEVSAAAESAAKERAFHKALVGVIRKMMTQDALPPLLERAGVDALDGTTSFQVWRWIEDNQESLMFDRQQGQYRLGDKAKSASEGATAQ